MPCHSYIFFDSQPSINAVPTKTLEKYKRDFCAAAQKSRTARIDSYATLGFKPDTRFMLHVNAPSADLIQDIMNTLIHTDLGKHLKITYTLFGMTRPSPYNPKHAPPESAPDVAHRYLVVYPFTKTTQWHMTPYEERRNVMKAHVGVGRKFTSTISQLLLYAYGVDDHEFIVSYQTDILADFQTLVMELRNTESRRETKNDLPIFLCVHRSLKECVDMV